MTDLPISKAAAVRCATWLVTNFGDEMSAAVAGKAYGRKHLAGIVCQETAIKWLEWTDHHPPAEIVKRCVFDASGEVPGAPRTAFPVNTAAFRAKYGDAFTNMLIEEANKTRRWQGWSDKPWVYKGYGPFQYDLQAVVTDRAFFEQKQWYDFSACLARCCSELDRKLAAKQCDLWHAITAYNGSGARAETDMANVKEFTDACAPVTG
jgi:hypothetical protein